MPSWFGNFASVISAVSDNASELARREFLLRCSRRRDEGRISVVLCYIVPDAKITDCQALVLSAQTEAQRRRRTGCLIIRAVVRG